MSSSTEPHHTTDRRDAGKPDSGTTRRGTLSGTGLAYAICAFVEAFTWAGLLVGMYFKHIAGTTDLGVEVFGALHGAAFLVYVAMTFLAAFSLRWSWKVTVVALLAAIPPLFTVPMEIWLRRTGRLDRRPVEV
ncbi:MAG: DUF3817 domain-containing protein [Brachybacterium sp.]|nr:DUF3817 domain-containing protein [Brachybacterium sp.]